MVEIPWPITHAPGDEAQEGAGQLINMFAERKGDDQGVVWRRAPGCTVWVSDPADGTANGSAVALAVSSVVNAAGEMCGVAVAAAVGSQPTYASGAGQANGTASGVAETGFIQDSEGEVEGSSTAEGAS